MSGFMTSLLVCLYIYLFLSKVATHTQSSSLSAIFFHMCISVSQLVSHIPVVAWAGIAAFADVSVFAGITVYTGVSVFAGITVYTGIAAFAHLRRLNVTTWTWECTEKNWGNERLGKQAMEVLDYEEKTTTDSKSSRKNTGYTRDLHGQ